MNINTTRLYTVYSGYLYTYKEEKLENGNIISMLQHDFPDDICENCMEIESVSIKRCDGKFFIDTRFENSVSKDIFNDLIFSINYLIKYGEIEQTQSVMFTINKDEIKSLGHYAYYHEIVKEKDIEDLNSFFDELSIIYNKNLKKDYINLIIYDAELTVYKTKNPFYGLSIEDMFQ